MCLILLKRTKVIWRTLDQAECAWFWGRVCLHVCMCVRVSVRAHPMIYVHMRYRWNFKLGLVVVTTISWMESSLIEPIIHLVHGNLSFSFALSVQQLHRFNTTFCSHPHYNTGQTCAMNASDVTRSMCTVNSLFSVVWGEVPLVNTEIRSR